MENTGTQLRAGSNSNITNEPSDDKEELIFSGEITFHKDKDGRYQTTSKVYYRHPLMPTIPETEQNS